MQAYPPGFIKDVRNRVAEVISGYSANDVPAICRRYGLASGERDEAMGGKFKYVSKRMFELTNDLVLEAARKVAQEEGDQGLIDLLASIEPKSTAPTPGFHTPKRAYYAERTGKGVLGGRLNLATLKALYKTEYDRWDEDGYFQEHFGFWCVDIGYVNGTLGSNIDAKMMFALGKEGLWPIHDKIADYTEDDLFSVIEFVFDHISKPIKGTMHQWNQCGMHWEEFDGPAGQAEYRASVNTLLARYEKGYELSHHGEVAELGPTGTANLLTTELPVSEDNIKGRVDSAVTKFRQRRSTTADRRDAVRDLADVLEYLRPRIKEVLTKADENDLFNIANNFSVRHHNDKQKSDYDPAIWLSWMFYFYLATIHACVRLIEKAKA
ncbi:hypothetical protein [Phenylobacterium montanum]|uniref:Uncharacterized protein n=1 Tax=Phenylobacterium montanum TaxID=2823693 RepID=A0A975G4M7_9CAUL|nr:hypothetical protein [Caulobacter sp. S6]QUD90561.1 hypothetical protein KCG34_12170 [Caulobacter sp. S6]